MNIASYICHNKLHWHSHSIKNKSAKNILFRLLSLNFRYDLKCQYLVVENKEFSTAESEISTLSLYTYM